MSAARQQPRVTVRPNRHTFALGAALVAMWYAAAAQANGAVYLLAFACAGMAMLSWLHARANLRDIEVQAGDLIAETRGKGCRLPFRLNSKGTRAASGIEIAAANARSSVFVAQLEPGAPFRAELILPTTPSGPAQPSLLLIRSLYPLGFFTAELRLPLSRTRKTMPLPEGDLPLPSPVKTDASKSAGTVSFGRRGVAGNDDFAGLRPWQPGDSPRHIDWKAVARDRPMMTKQWSGSQDTEVILDWNSLTLDDAEKAGQFAKWIQDCEANAIPFSLVLPALKIPAGLGPAHARRCLEALGTLMPHRLPDERASRQRIPFVHETSALSSKGTLAGLCAGLALTLPPMFGEVSVIAMILLIVAMGVRFHGGRWCAPLARLAYVLLGGGLVFAMENDHRTMEAATALLLVFIGAKVIESRTPRDFQVVGLLGWFLCMCGLSLEQSLVWSLHTAGVFLLITAALARLRRGPGQTKKSVRAAFSLMAQALPVMVMLFLFFPRGNEDLVARLARRNSGRSGLTTNLDPGSIATVALSDKIAFRAQISGDQRIAPRDRYWRCLVLWNCNGLSWRRGAGGGRSKPPPPDSKIVRQTIAVEPHGSYWLPSLDRAVAVEPNGSGAFMGDDDTVVCNDSVDNARRFVVASSPVPARGSLPGTQRSAALRVPADVSERVASLARSFRKSPASTDQDVMTAALDYLREQGFKYTLEPGSYEANGLDEFLLSRRLGFCEHFSASFATLMRLAGVPSRVVVGYLGGEYSERGGYWIVRQYDAHAWTEVWLEETGWTRVDPTAELNPDRLTSDLETSLAGADSAQALSRRTWWWRAWSESRLLWDKLDYEWYNRVVSADEQAQMDTLSSLGLGRTKWAALLVILGAGVVITALGVFLWLKRTARHPDPAARLWLSVCRRLAKAGVPRQPGETATAFATRAAKEFPSAAVGLMRISERYNEARYGATHQNINELRLAVEDLGSRLKARLPLA